MKKWEGSSLQMWTTPDDNFVPEIMWDARPPDHHGNPDVRLVWHSLVDGEGEGSHVVAVVGSEHHVRILKLS